MPAVSIISPAYNVAPYIRAAVESVMAQTFTDFELILVDDQSTDSTLDIAREYARGDSRIHVLQQPNGGISVARNHALRHATASVFAILDSDDLWHPTFLETQLAVLHQRPEIDIVTGNGVFLGGRLDGQYARPYPDRRPAPDLANILRDETAVFIMSVFHRRVYDTIGGFDEHLRTNEDYDFWLRAAIAGFTFFRNDKPLGFYRRRDDSLSASELRMLRGILQVLKKTRPAILERPVELAILEGQIARFDTERLAAEARAAIEAGDFALAGAHLAALHARRGGTTIGAARLMARWTPSLLSMAYNFRRGRPVQSVGGVGDPVSRP